jgi:hypothetical protein
MVTMALWSTSLKAWTWAVRPPVRRARGRRRPPKIWRRPWPSSTLDGPLEELRILVGQVGEQWHHDNLDLWWFMLIYVTLNVGFQGSLQQKKQTRRRARKAGNCVVQLSCSRVWYLISPSKSSVGLPAHFSSSVSTWDGCIWVMGVAGMCRAWCILNWLVISKPQGGAPQVINGL